MGVWKFYDDEETDDGDSDPSFSIHDFKKWLSKERVEKKKTINENVVEKDNLKEAFKRKIHNRVEKNIEKKLKKKKN